MKIRILFTALAAITLVPEVVSGAAAAGPAADVASAYQAYLTTLDEETKNIHEATGFKDLTDLVKRIDGEATAQNKNLKGHELGFATVVESQQRLVGTLLEVIKLNKPDEKGSTQLHNATAQSNGSWGDYLRKLLGKKNILINFKNVRGETPLHVAVLNNKINAIKLLLEKGANPNIVEAMGRTPLWMAVLNGKMEAIIELLKNEKTDPNIANDDGETPLFGAVLRDRDDIVKALHGSGKIDWGIESNNEAIKAWNKKHPADKLEAK